MDLLTIVHQDFTLSIECSKFGAIWDKDSRLHRRHHQKGTAQRDLNLYSNLQLIRGVHLRRGF